MAHVTEILGTELEGMWFRCSCGVEGALYEDAEAAEMEASVHVTLEGLPG